MDLFLELVMILRTFPEYEHSLLDMSIEVNNEDTFHKTESHLKYSFLMSGTSIVSEWPLSLLKSPLYICTTFHALSQLMIEPEGHAEPMIHCVMVGLVALAEDVECWLRQKQSDGSRWSDRSKLVNVWKQSGPLE